MTTSLDRRTARAAGGSVDVHAVHEAIADELRRIAAHDVSQLAVRADGGVVWLTGRVHSRETRDLIEQATWGQPGVRGVRNELTVG